MLFLKKCFNKFILFTVVGFFINCFAPDIEDSSKVLSFNKDVTFFLLDFPSSCKKSLDFTPCKNIELIAKQELFQQFANQGASSGYRLQDRSADGSCYFASTYKDIQEKFKTSLSPDSFVIVSSASLGTWMVRWNDKLTSNFSCNYWVLAEPSFSYDDTASSNEKSLEVLIQSYSKLENVRGNFISSFVCGSFNNSYFLINNDLRWTKDEILLALKSRFGFNLRKRSLVVYDDCCESRQKSASFEILSKNTIEKYKQDIKGKSVVVFGVAADIHFRNALIDIIQFLPKEIIIDLSSSFFYSLNDAEKAIEDIYAECVDKRIEFFIAETSFFNEAENKVNFNCVIMEDEVSQLLFYD